MLKVKKFLSLALAGTILVLSTLGLAGCGRTAQDEMELEKGNEYVDVMLLKEADNVYSMHNCSKYSDWDASYSTKCGYKCFGGKYSYMIHDGKDQSFYNVEIRRYDHEDQIHPALLAQTEKCPECYGEVEAE